MSMVISWAFIYNSGIDIYLNFDDTLRSNRLETVLISPAALWRWLLGLKAAIYLLNIPAAIITFTIAHCVSNDTSISAMQLLLLSLFTLVASEALSSICLAVRLRLSQAFNAINFAMDTVQVLSCIVYPVTVLPLVLRTLSTFLPTTHLAEFTRSGQPIRLILTITLSAALITGGGLMFRLFLDHARAQGWQNA
jgi:ABC-type polysaccharide/polyol phosphate export permease